MKQLQDQFLKILEQVESGDINFLEAVIEVRKIKLGINSLLKDLDAFENEYYNEIQMEASEHQNEYKGAKFEFRNGRKMFDFKGIDEVEKANQELKAIKDKYQSAWENRQKGLVPIDEETGEILNLPVVKYGKSSLVVKL